MVVDQLDSGIVVGAIATKHGSTITINFCFHEIRQLTSNDPGMSFNWITIVIYKFSIIRNVIVSISTSLPSPRRL